MPKNSDRVYTYTFLQTSPKTKACEVYGIEFYRCLLIILYTDRYEKQLDSFNNTAKFHAKFQVRS